MADLITIEEVSQRLRDAITEGIGGVELQALVTTLAATSDNQVHAIQRIADAVKGEQQDKSAIASEAANLAAESDRRELGQVLTLGYLLPPSIASALETRCKYLPTDGPSAALPFLAAVAGLVKLGTQVEASAVAGYRVPVNLFACTVAKSGAKKSPLGRLVVEWPTKELVVEMATANKRALDEWQQACKGMKKSEEKPSPPFPRRLRVSEYTGEALAAQLQEQEKSGLGLLIYRDELAGLFASLNQYKGGRGGDEQQLLELFDGGGLTSLRIAGDRIYTRSQVSIYGSTQPEVLRELVAKGDASGLWARFLFVPLPPRAIALPMTTTPAEEANVEAAAGTLAKTCRTVYQLTPATYRLDQDAADLFVRYEYQRQQSAQGAIVGAQSALYGKSAGKVLRVAGVLHLLHIAAGDATKEGYISAGCIERATALVDHLDAWALGLHAEVAAGGSSQLMRTIHRASETAREPVGWKQIQNRLSKTQRSTTDAAAAALAMHALADAGYGEVEVGNRGATTYRATRELP
jgi:CRISPR-associated protein Cmr3